MEGIKKEPMVNDEVKTHLAHKLLLHDYKKLNGVFYTPSSFANYVAEKVVSLFIDNLSKTDIASSINRSMKDWRFLDPACGDGELLEAIWLAISNHKMPISGFLDVAKISPTELLCGVDIDDEALIYTRKRIKGLSDTKVSNESSFKLIRTNALFPFGLDCPKDGWSLLLEKFDAKGGVDILISNPPWGADVSEYHDKLTSDAYNLSKGQYDTSDLFIEMALSIVRPDGFFAFILPDSLFSHERRALRHLLLQKTQIHYIGRFGEGIFPNIARGCALIICQNAPRKRELLTTCLRLTPELRQDILLGRGTFASIEQERAHKISQSRFEKHRNVQFNIDLSAQEEKTIKHFEKQPKTFRDYLQSSRGAELSKYGKISQCNECSMWLPLPKRKTVRCPYCGVILKTEELNSDNIVSRNYVSGYTSIFVGECINRYKLSPSWWIDPNRQGIRYKEKIHYCGPKLLVRKTGVGLTSVIDYTDAYTNQVVYMFRLKQDIKMDIPLEAFLAILNSRAVYFYLVKTYGETEWRSHPYVTQKQILDLPLPSLEEVFPMINRIADLVHPYSILNTKLPADVDANVERLVGSIYGLSKNEYMDVYRALDLSEQLIPVKSLRETSIDEIFHNRKE